MTTRGMARFDGYAPPGRGVVGKIIESSNDIAAHKNAVDEIRELCDSLRKDAVIPSRRIRQILKRHGITATNPPER